MPTRKPQNDFVDYFVEMFPKTKEYFLVTSHFGNLTNYIEYIAVKDKAKQILEEAINREEKATGRKWDGEETPF